MERLDAVFSLAGVRAAGVGTWLVLAPQRFRKLLKGFLGLSNNQLRVIGYVLLGTAASILVQQASKRALSAKIDALAKQHGALPNPA